MSSPPDSASSPHSAPSIDADAPSLERIRDVAQRLSGRVLRTPTVRWPTDHGSGAAELLIKLELLQRTGSFKARGALNTVESLSDPQRGVVAFSAGNHAIATAWAGRELGVDVVVVMPRSANPARVRRVHELGATIEFGDDIADLFGRVERIQARDGRALVHPFEGVHTIEGTATLGLEIVEDAIALGGPPDVVVVPIGGGGLAAGVARAVAHLAPECRVVGVEPSGADGMRQSLAAGAPLATVQVNTIADSLGAPMHRPLSYSLVARHVHEIVTVDDAAMVAGMRRLFDEVKLAAEPACAASLAALPMLGDLSGQRVVLIACGSNIDAHGWARHVGALTPDPVPDEVIAR